MRLPVVVDISCHHLTTIAICLLCSLCIGREIVVEQRLISENKQPYNNEPKKRHQRQHNINFQFYMSQLLHFHWAKPFSLAITIRFRDFSLSCERNSSTVLCGSHRNSTHHLQHRQHHDGRHLHDEEKREAKQESKKKEKRFSSLFLPLLIRL